MSERSPFVRWLASEGAGHDFVSWVETSGLSWPAVYDACPRADFVLAVAVRAGVPRDALVATAAVLAGRALEELVDPGLEAGLRELDATRVDADRLRKLADRFEYEADSSNDLVLSHGFRVLALAAAAAEEPEGVVAIPGLAVELALASVMDCAMTSVIGSLQDELAGLVREHLPASSIPIRW